MKTAVIIPNWNGEEYLGDSIDSLLAQSVKATVVVVDNGSSDKSLDIIRSYGSNIVEIKRDKNYGFTGGVNSGILYALENDYDAIALFNNDAVADPKWLFHLIEEARSEESVGIVTGLLLHSEKPTIDSTGELYSKWGLPFPRDRNNPISRQRKSEYVFGATGGASLYKASLFKDIGIFDQDFFAYYEDVDISFRAQLAGWQIKYTPHAITFHKQGATSNRLSGFTTYQTFKNLPWVFIKNTPKGLLIPVGGRFYTAYILMLAKAIITGNALSALRGYLTSIYLTPKKIIERASIQKKNRVSTGYIRSILWDDLPPNQLGLRKLRKLFINR